MTKGKKKYIYPKNNHESKGKLPKNRNQKKGPNLQKKSKNFNKPVVKVPVILDPNIKPQKIYTLKDFFKYRELKFKNRLFKDPKNLESKVKVHSFFKFTKRFSKVKRLLQVDLKNYIQKNLKSTHFIQRRRFFTTFFKTKVLKAILKKRKLLTNNKFITKKRFLTFFKKNNLYNIFNLRQDFPYPNFLQSKSEIQRAAVFRDLVNKEEAYYKTISKSPLIILLSPKPKNIYITVYTLPESSSGYKILWKKSTGMLEKVEGQLSFAALVELFNKLNIFLAKEFLYFQNPIRLIIKSTKYYGTNHLIQNFVKMFQKNMNLNYIYFMYKYRKRFNFFNNYATLINDAVFNYISSIWLKFLKLIRRTKLSTKYIFSVKELKIFNKFFGIEFDFARRRYKINHFARLKRLKSLKNKTFTKKVKKVKKVIKNVKQRKNIIAIN